MFLTNMLSVRSQQRIRPAGDMDKATANVVPAEAGEGGHGSVPVEGSVGPVLIVVGHEVLVGLGALGV